ncbi:uncharacterized protein AB9X84_018452 isoform 2-T2 [Acanthopagrus schlegelii]
MAAGLVKRYREAGEAPPKVIYVDRDCCSQHGPCRVKAMFAGWDELQVRLDIWHFMRRFAAGVTTEAHPLYGIFMARLSTCIFEWDPEDVAALRRAKEGELAARSVGNISEEAVTTRITRRELALHCRRRTRGVEETNRLIGSLISLFDSASGKDTLGVPLLDHERIQQIWMEQQKHLGCIQDPEDFQLYIKTGTLKKGNVELCCYRCARGSTSLESFHLHLNRFIPGELLGMEYLYSQTGKELTPVLQNPQEEDRLVEEVNDEDFQDEGFVEESMEDITVPVLYEDDPSRALQSRPSSLTSPQASPPPPPSPPQPSSPPPSSHLPSPPTPSSPPQAPASPADVPSSNMSDEARIMYAYPVFRRQSASSTILLMAPSEEARALSNTGSGRAKPKEEVLAEATTFVTGHGGDPADRLLVLAYCQLHFGMFQGQRFRWLLENSLGYAVYLLHSISKETVQANPLSKNKQLFQEFTSQIREMMVELEKFSRKQEMQKKAKDTGDQGYLMVEFGDFKGRSMKEVYEDQSQKAQALINYLKTADARPNTNMAIFKTYVLKRRTAASTLPSSASTSTGPPPAPSTSSAPPAGFQSGAWKPATVKSLLARGNLSPSQLVKKLMSPVKFSPAPQLTSPRPSKPRQLFPSDSAEIADEEMVSAAAQCEAQLNTA